MWGVTAGYARAKRAWGALWVDWSKQLLWWYLLVQTRYLYPQDQLRQSWSDGKREGGTEIVFFTDELKNRDKTLRYWFYGKDRELAAEIKQRLCVFARSGSDGSICALWMNDTSETKIVCVWVRAQRWPVFCLIMGLIFLRLIAIGYDEICWDENFSMPPNSEGSYFIVYSNVDFQQWIKDMFKTTIPQTALELVTPAHMDDENSNDEFLIWVNRITEWILK